MAKTNCIAPMGYCWYRKFISETEKGLVCLGGAQKAIVNRTWFWSQESECNVFWKRILCPGFASLVADPWFPDWVRKLRFVQVVNDNYWSTLSIYHSITGRRVNKLYISSSYHIFHGSGSWDDALNSASMVNSPSRPGRGVSIGLGMFVTLWWYPDRCLDIS